MSKCSVNFNMGSHLGKKQCKDVKKKLGAIAGVTSVTIGDNGAQVGVDYDDTGVTSETLRSKLDGMGCQVTSQTSTNNHG